MQTATELYCTKAFGGDDAKLRRFLAKKGGFDAEQIQSVRTFQVRDWATGKMMDHARIFVNGSMQSIRSGMERINKKKAVIRVNRMKRNEQSNKLMVKNFDILTKDDHRRFTALFSRFGPLECAVEMGRNRDGVNWAVVTYREADDARSCEWTQNDERRQHRLGVDPLRFNGRELMIGYAAESERKHRRGRR